MSDQVAEFEYVRRGLRDPLQSAGAVEIRDETLVRLGDKEAQAAIDELVSEAQRRGYLVTWERIQWAYVTVIRWEKLPPASLASPATDHRPAPLHHPEGSPSSPVDEVRASGWSS